MVGSQFQLKILRQTPMLWNEVPRYPICNHTPHWISQSSVLALLQQVSRLRTNGRPRPELIGTRCLSQAAPNGTRQVIPHPPSTRLPSLNDCGTCMWSMWDLTLEWHWKHLVLMNANHTRLFYIYFLCFVLFVPSWLIVFWFFNQASRSFVLALSFKVDCSSARR